MAYNRPEIIAAMKANAEYADVLAQGDENGDMLWDEDYKALDHLNDITESILNGNYDGSKLVDALVAGNLIDLKEEWK